MTRILIFLGASATIWGSFTHVSALPPPAPRVISQTKDGKPILLARMVITATPLDE